MPDDLLDNAFTQAFEHPDQILTLLIGGIQRAEERYKAKLNTVDADGNLIVPRIEDNDA